MDIRKLDTTSRIAAGALIACTVVRLISVFFGEEEKNIAEAREISRMDGGVSQWQFDKRCYMLQAKDSIITVLAETVCPESGGSK